MNLPEEGGHADKPATAFRRVALAGALFLEAQGAMVDDLKEKKMMLNPLSKTFIDHVTLILPCALFLAKVHTHDWGQS